MSRAANCNVRSPDSIGYPLRREMQIEFIGCTSSGKTTLVKNLQQANLAQGIQAYTSHNFVLIQMHLDWITNDVLRKLLLHLLAFFACLLTCRKNWKFFERTTQIILHLPPSVPWQEKLKIARLVLRNVGVYEIVKAVSSPDQVVLADEGTLQIAHHLFVHVSVEPNLDDLETFIQLVPLPDAIVYVKQSESVLVERTLVRGHRRIPGQSVSMVSCFIDRASLVFDVLASQNKLQNKLFVIDSSNTAI